MTRACLLAEIPHYHGASSSTDRARSSSTILDVQPVPKRPEREGRLDEGPAIHASPGAYLEIWKANKRGTSSRTSNPLTGRDAAGVERHHHMDGSVHRERRQPNALQGVPRPGSGDEFRAMVGATRRGFRMRGSASLIGLAYGRCRDGKGETKKLRPHPVSSTAPRERERTAR
jgi:hypothetical protein